MIVTLEVVRKEGNFFIVKQPGIDTFTEIEDTFAKMCHHSVVADSVLGTILFFLLGKLLFGCGNNG